jgi:hypothetical protein
MTNNNGLSGLPTAVRVKAHKVCVGMTVLIAGDDNEWVTLARHPVGGHWWLHRWSDTGEWITDHASYRHMTQILREPGQ